MACNRRRKITLSQTKQLATNYAIKNQIDVIVYSCSDYNFCPEEFFNYEKYIPIMKICKDGKIIKK